MKSFKQHIQEYKRYDKGRIESVAGGLQLIGIDPKTGKDEFIMRGNKKDRKKMEDFAKQHSISLKN